MVESKLLQLVKKLTLKQKKELAVFLQMPSVKILNRDQKILEELLKAVHKGKVKPEASLWESILTKEEFDNSKRIKNRLLKGLERYLAMEQLEAHKPLKSYLLSQYYFKNQLKKNVLNHLSQTLKWLDQAGEEDQNRDLWQYLLLEQENHYWKGIRSKNNNLEQLENHLDNFYAINKMRIITENISRQRIISDYTIKSNYEKEIAELKKKSTHPLFQLYCDIYILIVEEDERYYYAIKNRLDQPEMEFNPDFQKELYGHLLNFCIRQINERKRHYVKEYFLCVKKLDDQEQLLDSGFIAIGRFSNCVNAAISLGQLEWASSFVDRYSPFLEYTNEVDGHQFVNLNKAMIALAKKDLEACFKYCTAFRGSKMYKKDFYLKISADKILMKALYEEGSYNVLATQIVRVEKYLDKDTPLSEDRKTVQVCFLNCLKTLLDKTPIKLEELKQKLLVFDYYWLEKQV